MTQASKSVFKKKVSDSGTLGMDKVLYRAVGETVNKLNDIYKHGTPQETVFSKESLGCRFKLKERLVKLMFLEPAEFGKRGEDILWRKVFYEPIQMVKQCKKVAKSQRSPLDTSYRLHLVGGIGFYQKLMLRLQLEYGVDCTAEGLETSWVDLHGMPDTEFDEESAEKSNKRRLHSEDVKSWAVKALHRCLVYIGDLFRYELDLKEAHAKALAQRYYQMAIIYRPNFGMPYNQLGTLDTTSWYSLNAVFNYLRCLVCDSPFDGARGNLETIFQKNARRFSDLRSAQDKPKFFKAELQHRVKDVKRFMVKFLRILENLVCPSTEDAWTHHPQLCEEVMAELNLIMYYEDGFSVTMATSQGRLSEVGRLDRLNDTGVFRMMLTCVMALALVQRQEKEAADEEGVVDASRSGFHTMCMATILSVMGVVFNHAVSRLTNQLSQTLGLDGEVMLPSLHASDEDEGLESTATDDKQESEIGADVGSSTEVAKKKRKKPRRYLDLRRRRPGEVKGDNVSEGESDSSDGTEWASESSSEEEDREAYNVLSSGSEASDEDIDLWSGVESPMNSQDEDEALTTSNQERREKKKNLKMIREEASPGGTPKKRDSAQSSDFQASCSQLFASGNKVSLPAALAGLVSTGDDVSHPIDTEAQGVKESEDEEWKTGPTQCGRTDSTEPEGVLLLRRLEVVSNLGLLSTVKVMCDWMRGQPDVLTLSVQQASKALWQRLAILLNLTSPVLKLFEKREDVSFSPMHHPEMDLTNPSEWKQTIPLPEDVHMRGFAPLRCAHETVSFVHPVPQGLEQALFRVHALVAFGHFAAGVEGFDFGYRADRGLFTGPVCGPAQPELRTESQGQETRTYTNVDSSTRQAEEREQEKMAHSEARRNQLMRDMAQLRLRMEVQQLEEKSKESRPLSPYLVPDTYALCSCLHHVRSLVRSGRFIVVVPQAVIDHLDHMKKESGQAREVIRYLETQTHKGHRFIRVQRASERADDPSLNLGHRHGLPRATVRWRRVLACAAYLAEGGSEPGLVCILTDRLVDMEMDSHQGISPDCKEQAQKYGIAVENVDEFVAKWKSTQESAKPTEKSTCK